MLKIGMIVKTPSIVYDGRVRKEAETLHNNNYDVVIHVLRDLKFPQINKIDNSIVKDIKLISRKLPQNIIFNIIKYIELILKMSLIGLISNYDIYHAHDLDVLLPWFIAAKLKRKRIIYDAHELWTERKHVKGTKFLKYVEKILVKYVDAIITPEENRSRIILNEYNVKKMPTTIMNVPKLKSIKANNYLKQAVHSTINKDNIKIILNQGTISPDRCITSIIESLKYLPDDYILVFLGFVNKNYKQDLIKLINSTNLMERVVFLQPVNNDELIEYISSAYLSIIFYKNNNRNNYYCAPNRLYEALAAGVPVVTNDYPGLINIINKFHCGRYVDYSKPEQIAKVILSISYDYASYTKNAKESYIKELNWDNEAIKLTNLYNNMR